MLGLKAVVFGKAISLNHILKHTGIRHSFAFALFRLIIAGSLTVGQAGANPNEATRLEYDKYNNTWSFTWWGHLGNTYFIQQSDDLVSWRYMPFIIKGEDEMAEWQFSNDKNTTFVRLKYTDMPTSDPRNDDFDSDDISNWDELLQQSDPLATDDQDSNGIPDDWELFWNDQFGVFPSTVAATLTHRDSTTQQLYLNNPVNPNANFTVTLSNNLAGTQIVYDYEDNLTGGAIYNWTDISTSGILLDGISKANNHYEGITLTQFSFPFYGTDFTELFVNSNGLITVGSGSYDYSGYPIPSVSYPDHFITPFSRNQDPSKAGNIFYKEEADRLIVQYESVAPYPDTGSFTYQAVLHSSGVIEFFYKKMIGDLESATVGLENGDGTDGLEIAHNESYIEDGLAVRIFRGPAYFVKVSPLAGTTTTDTTSALNVSFNTYDLAPGTYNAGIEIAHTGTGSSPRTIPAVLEVTNPPAAIAITSPADGDTIWSDETFRIRVSASDDDFGIERVEFFYNETKLGEDASPYYYDDDYYWADPIIGSYVLTARAVDQFGTVTISDPVNVTVFADSDGDRLEDPWEILYFGDLSQDDLGDFDGDGAVNRLEYDRGTDPSDNQDIPVNLPSVVEITRPDEGFTQFEGDSIDFYAPVSDPDSELDYVEFYYGTNLIGTDNRASSGLASKRWDTPPAGTHSLIARVVDIYGDSTDSSPVTIAVLADSDLDRMDDAWEQQHFGSLNQEASADFDGDSVPNVFEYNHKTDPTDALSKLSFTETQTGDYKYFIVDKALAAETTVKKKTLSAAISSANDYDMIEVHPGTYNEVLGRLNDRLYVFGAEGARNTIIDLNGLNNPTLYLYSESVFAGLTFQGANTGSSSYTGGALYLRVLGKQNKPRFIGCRFIDNTVGDQSGAIFIRYGDPMFISCTIAGNTSANGNAIYNSSRHNQIVLVNTLLWNPGTSTEIGGYPSAIVFDHSLTRDDLTGNVLIDNVDQLTMNPGLAFDYSLFAASVARDAGTLSHYATTDLDGETLADGFKDIGADEFTDSDSDGLPDWIESLSGSDLAAGSDDDSDYLTNLEDYNSGANPLSNDTDGDGLLDGDELFSDGTYGDTDGYTTEVNNSDTDADELGDGWEVDYGFNPTSANAPATDSDGDGLTDKQEFSSGGNPFSADTDGDGMPDLFEFNNGLNLAYNDASLDRDSDALSNLLEYEAGTNLNYFDSDDDLLGDGWEVNQGLNPLQANPLDGDSDQDGLDTYDEYLNGTNPSLGDSDSDGTPDGREVAQGSNPANANDNGQSPATDKLQEVNFTVGDPSGSHSERWEMTITGLGADTRVMRLSNRDFGTMTNPTPYKLWKDSNYEITIAHLGTKQTGNGPDYDWQAQVEGTPSNWVLTGGNKHTGTNRFSVIHNQWILDNEDGLLGIVDESFNNSNHASDKSAKLLKVDVEEISFSGSKYHELKSDDLNETYSAPHWVDTNGDGDADDPGDKNYPIAYTRNTKPKIEAKFELGSDLSGQTIKIRATGPSGIAISEKTAIVSGGTVTLPETESTGAFANTIKHYDHKTSGKEFELAWEMQIGSSGWFSVGETKHTLYLTLADPVTTLRQETLFYVGCRLSDGKSNVSDAVSAVWHEFSDQVVNRVNQTRMTYWANNSASCTDTESLIKDGNGQCGSWAEFFIDSIKLHGIGDAKKIYLTPIYQNDRQTQISIGGETRGLMLVKNWSFSSGSAPAAFSPFRHLPIEASDQHGVAGQGNDNPPPAFYNHFIVKHGGQYYDPSYGGPVYSSQEAWENASLDGFSKVFRVSLGGVPDDLPMFKENTPDLETIFIEL